MKKITIILTLFLFLIAPVYGNDGVLGGKGNTVYPIFDTSVKMLSENVFIEVKEGKSFVRCEFVLKNTGENEKLMVGFPAYGTASTEEVREGFDDDPKLYDFKTFINGKEVKASVKKGLKEEGNNKGELYYPNWFTWEMRFKTNEVFKVVNTYWVHNSYDSVGGETIEYILRTGATWKDKINYGKITMEFDELIDPQDINIIDYDSYKNDEKVRIQLHPKEKRIIWEFHDLEPTFDLKIYKKDGLEATKNYVLNQYMEDSRSINAINGLGRKAYESFIVGDHEKTLENIKKVEAFKDDKDKAVSEYALIMTNWLDYYRASIYEELGDFKQAEYYYKASGILQNGNYYYLMEMYKNSGDLDKYIQGLKGIIRGNFYNQAIVPWAQQEFEKIPLLIRQKYEVQLPQNEEEKDNQPIEEEALDRKPNSGFSTKSFILINMGIFTFILVIYWNIKKRK